MHGTIRELPGEGLIGQFSFRENHHTGGGFIEPMDDGEIRPARFSVAEPIEDSFAGERGGRVGVQAGGFQDDKEVLILVQNAGR